MRLESNHPLPYKMTAVERKKLTPTIAKVKALLGNGLTGIDLVQCWVAWWIIPLSCRTGLMCTYTGSKKDPLRHSSEDLTDDAINEMTKSLLHERPVDCSKVGLSPFCKSNPTPEVSRQITYFTFIHNILL